MNAEKIAELYELLIKVYKLAPKYDDYPWLKFLNTSCERYAVASPRYGAVSGCGKGIFYNPEHSTMPVIPEDGWELIDYPWDTTLIEPLERDVENYRKALVEFEKRVLEIKTKDYVDYKTADDLAKLRTRLYGINVYMRSDCSSDIPLHIQFASGCGTHYLWYDSSGNRHTTIQKVSEESFVDMWSAAHSQIHQPMNKRIKYKLISDTGRLIMDEDILLSEAERAAWDLIDEIENLLNEESYNGI